MNKLALFLLCVAVNSNAACLSNWEVLHTPIGRDHKAIHLLGSAAVTYMVAEVSGNPWAGLAAGVALGAAREKQKLNFGGNCEWTSIAFDAAGVAMGYTASKHWHFAPLDSGGALLQFETKF
jgi:hypothetical protein